MRIASATLVFRSDAAHASARAFLDEITRERISVVNLPTAYWHELVAELERGAVRLPDAVRLVIIGGERALPERVAAWRRSVGDGVRTVRLAQGARHQAHRQPA